MSHLSCFCESKNIWRPRCWFLLFESRSEWNCSGWFSGFFSHNFCKWVEIQMKTRHKHLTMLDIEILSALKPWHCFDRKNEINSNTKLASIHHGNNIFQMICSTVLSSGGELKRKDVIEKWILVAQECLGSFSNWKNSLKIVEVLSRKRLKVLGNYSTMNMIVATLNNYSILRLHRTWRIVETSFKDLLEEMNQLIFRPIYDSSRPESKPVLIPFLGYYFTRKGDLLPLMLVTSWR